MWYCRFGSEESREGGPSRYDDPHGGEQQAMFRTKEGVRRSLSRTLWVLAPGLCIASLGCTETGGLRSVWPDRPTLLGFWDRKPQPPPDPADDYYARYMHAARERSDLLARRSRDDADAAGPSRDDDETRPPGPSDTRLADESPAPSTSRTSGRDFTPAERPPRDETIQVTLGTPEPLPSASNRAGTATRLDIHAEAAARAVRHRRHRRSRTPGRSSTAARPSSSRSGPTRSRCRGSNESTAACSPRKRSS